VGYGVAVGGTLVGAIVAVGDAGMLVGGITVAVGDAGVLVGGIAVAVGGTGVLVGGKVAVGGIGVDVGVGFVAVQAEISMIKTRIATVSQRLAE
jgi:hypothetical protein